jgi:hypothetical protein
VSDEVLARTRAVMEVERAIRGMLSRCPASATCERCGVTHPFALGRIGNPILCYEHKTGHGSEDHHPKTYQAGPVIAGPANENRFLERVEHIRRRYVRGGLILDADFDAGLAAWVSMRLAGLGSLRP